MSAPGHPAGAPVPRRCRARGSSPIEVLVALTVTAVAMLGLAGLLATSMTLARHHRHRQAAVWLAEDLAGQMRTNLAAAREGRYDVAVDDDALADGDTECLLAPHCTPDEQAHVDLVGWMSRVEAQLPRGQAEVRHDPVRQTVDVWVAWVDPGLPPPSAAGGCPQDWGLADAPAPRCVHLKVAL